MPQSGESTLKRLVNPSLNLFPTFLPASMPPGSGPPLFLVPHAPLEVLKLCVPRQWFLDPLTAVVCKLSSSHPSPAEEGVLNNRRQHLGQTVRLSACAGARTLHFRHADGSRGAQSRPRPREASNQNTVPLSTRSPGRWAGEHAHARCGPWCGTAGAGQLVPGGS